MGSTLEHGIYLPSEGEKNCYQGLAGNWNKVDGALGDVAELKQSIESKFTKEIVTELPTEDINPYCIYMILKTDPETDNVYDEWVYINNNWEYLGNTKVDMTQYYTKQEVNQLPAVASGVTATKVGNYDAHIANGDIHVTASDKAKWDTVALIKQLRLVNTQVGSATTIAFANIDDTNGIKVGDKCMDLDAKLFEITAVDTTNQTVTVGSALIDLALDGNVVHLSGSETITGAKYFNDIIYSIGGIQTRLSTQVTSGESSSKSWAFIDNAYKSLFKLVVSTNTDKSTRVEHVIYNVDSNNTETLNRITWRFDNNSSVSELRPTDNAIKLGTSLYRWSEVYATNYYYGANNVEFSTKFVTTDTNQTISGTKTFTDFLIYNSDTTAYASYLNLKNQRNVRGSSETGVQGIQFQDKNGKSLTMLESRVISNGNTGFNIICYNTDGNNQSVSDGVSVIKSPTETFFAPTTDNAVICGRPLAKWSDVQTYKVNGITPSSLGMPDIANKIDISGYITDLTGVGNEYTPPVNGWICVRSGNANKISILDSVTNIGNTSISNTATYLTVMTPVVANRKVILNVMCTSLEHAYFIPCQGNV